MTILHLVERERTAFRTLQVAAGAGFAIAATCLLLALAASLLGDARWLALPRAVPLLVWLLLVAANAGVFLWTWSRLRTRATRAGVASEIEREQALRAGSVRGVLEIAETGTLGRHAAQALSRRLETGGKRHSLAPRARSRARRLTIELAVAAAAAAAALGWAAPAYSDGLQAILRPVDAWNGTLLPRLEFRNVPPAILRGETLVLEVQAVGRTNVSVQRREPGEGWRTELLSVAPGSGLASLTIGPVRGDLSIIATDGRTNSDTILVRVTDRPFVGAVSIQARYPAYLGRAPEALPVGEPARIPRGTVLEVNGRASTELRAVRLHAGADTVAFRVSGHAFTGRFEPRTSGRFEWTAVAGEGSIGDVPPPLELELVADSAPVVQLVSPAADTIVAADDRVRLAISASDDHGLASVELVTWRRADNGNLQPRATQRLAEASAGGGGAVWAGFADLDLSTRGLRPGDALHVKVVATDNSPWAQRGESRELLLRVPTMEERRAMARETADSAVSEARAAAQAQRDLQRRTADAANDRRMRPDQPGDQRSGANPAATAEAMSYESAERARALAQEQRELTERVRALEDAAEALEQQLREAGALDSSLARQLQQAQALLREALTPELLAQMQKLEEGARERARDESQSNLRDLAAMQQRLREQLERSAAMLQRAAMEGAMETLKDEAREIAERERQLADSAGKRQGRDGGGDEQNRAEAQQLADRSERLAQDMRRLEERLQREQAEAGAQNTQAAREHARASQETMQRAAEGQRQDQPGSEQRRPQQGGEQRQQPQAGAEGNRMADAARQAAERMEQAAQSMEQARSGQVEAWKQELTSALDQAIQDMLQMAREENAMEQQVRSGQAKPDELRGQQSAIKQGLDAAAQRLAEEAQKTSLLSGRSQRSVSEAQQRVQQALQATADARPGTQAAGALGEAADALNRAAASLARDRERANSARSATGFAEMLQQMQELANRQGTINSQAEGLLPMPGNQMSPGMQATARALARQQRQLAQELDEISAAAGGDRAGQLAQEARQLAEALEGGRLDATTLARQQQLFRRLLDAGRSLEKEERDEDAKREARAFAGGDRFAPGAAEASGAAAQKFREPTWDELRGLSADERRAILEYFKRINATRP